MRRREEVGLRRGVVRLDVENAADVFEQRSLALRRLEDVVVVGVRIATLLVVVAGDGLVVADGFDRGQLLVGLEPIVNPGGELLQAGDELLLVRQQGHHLLREALQVAQLVEVRLGQLKNPAQTD